MPAAGGMLLAGCGTGLRLKAAWLGRLERAEDALLCGSTGSPGTAAVRPAKAVKAYRSTRASRRATRPRVERAARLPAAVMSASDHDKNRQSECGVPDRGPRARVCAARARPC
ncbi:hypothetical protein SALBM217S_09184 [Streptomyces griseoloalbus]